jgi:hypothetical protein
VLFKKVQSDAALSEITTPVGEIVPGDPGHSELAAELREVEREVVRCTFAMGVIGGHRQTGQPTLKSRSMRAPDQPVVSPHEIRVPRSARN